MIMKKLLTFILLIFSSFCFATGTCKMTKEEALKYLSKQYGGLYYIKGEGCPKYQCDPEAIVTALKLDPTNTQYIDVKSCPEILSIENIQNSLLRLNPKLYFKYKNQKNCIK